MSKKTKKQKEREKKQRKWKRENEQLRDFRAKAPYIKAFLRDRGCVLPFYDILDSYSAEFERIADGAKATHKSLLGVHEVADDILYGDNTSWEELGYSDLRQIHFETDEDIDDYGARLLDANLSGSMNAFLDADGQLCSIILLRRSVKASVQHNEWKYALKIATLLHEIGHVSDLEQGVNFDVSARRVKIIEAEAYAHLFALDQMAQRSLRHSFIMLADALKEATSKGGYLSIVAQKVMDKLPQHELIDWQSVFDMPPTPDELRRLGPKAAEALSK